MNNEVRVINNIQITPNMQRITLQGECLSAFSKNCAGNYIKLLFAENGSTDISIMPKGQRPIMRTYTIKEFLPEDNSIKIDFVRHSTHQDDHSYAAKWAKQASLGDKISLLGPGEIKDLNQDADWFFMVADMTAMPSLTTKIKRLPINAKGYAVIQVIDKDDIQPLIAPENIDVIWITATDSLANIVKSLVWKDGKVSIWAACEFDTMRELRQYFRNEKNVEREFIYISSYWKKGVSEDGHKDIKRRDATNI
ncbi:MULTISPECIES: siderophore-interacting protein [unclassified Photobacterium]|uniref:siderophore-interacting protein n=1 Tax=unclassified Photobacterium TaxID=2628852 RepID=UPI001EDDC33C|nr:MULTISPECIES: siderophore-interacting protein [unclassified Photobacterium]MCG3864499.1 siderophore-interacting protein [Photobacterium sp. Ph6]MCG3876608.1 siderophore-interacting protein [Photobacterium sp. Ph5]